MRSAVPAGCVPARRRAAVALALRRRAATATAAAPATLFLSSLFYQPFCSLLNYDKLQRSSQQQQCVPLCSPDLDPACKNRQLLSVGGILCNQSRLHQKGGSRKGGNR